MARRAPPRRSRGPPREEYGTKDDVLGSVDLDMERKKIVIEIKSNDQGKFMTIVEYQNSQSRGRIIFSSEKAFEFSKILREFVAEYDRLPPLEEASTESERLKTELFTQGRRRYFVDLRQNQRGRFLKVTMVTGRKTFVAIPGDSITQFRDALVSLLESHATEGEESGGGNEQRRPPLEPKSPAQSNSDILPSKEVRAGGKRFFFDVGQNDRGTFIKLSEVLNNGRRNRINIPHNCWGKMGEMFASYAKDMPLPSGDEESTGSASDN